MNKDDIYNATMKALRLSLENVWQAYDAKPVNPDMVEVVIPVTLEMLFQISDRAVIRTLEEFSKTFRTLQEMPTYSRLEAAKKLGKSAKTLRVWENNGLLVPTKLGNKAYYTLNALMTFKEENPEKFQ